MKEEDIALLKQRAKSAQKANDLLYEEFWKRAERHDCSLLTKQDDKLYNFMMWQSHELNKLIDSINRLPNE